MEEAFRDYQDKLPKKMLDEIQENVPKSISASKLKKILEAVYEEYKLASISPGEAVGVISAESIGEPGTQMSLDYEEKVVVKSQNKVKAVKIGEFIDRVMSKKANYAKNNDTEICDLSNAELFVPALSQNEKIEWKKVTALSRHKSPEMLLRIKTMSGRQITATPYHSFVIRKNNKIIPVAGSSLKIGDRIPSARKIVNLTNNEFLKLEDFLPKTEYTYESELRKAIGKRDDFTLPLNYEQINNYMQGNVKFQLKQSCVYMYQNHSVAQIPEVLELDYLFGFFIGAYLAEGALTEHYVAITNISEEYLQQIARFAQKYNINYKIKYEIGQYGKSTTLVLNSTIIADLLSKTCGKGAYNKYIPDFAYSAKPEFASALLNAYFSGDGNVNVLRKVIRASSCSRQLIGGILILLLQFGIFATKSVGGRNQHTLSISYRYSREFKEKINLVIPKKRTELKKLAQIKDSKTSYDLIDMVAGYGDILSVVGKKLNIPGRLINKFTKKQKIGRQALKKYIAIFEQKAKENNIAVEEELKVLKRMLNSDVIWDEIVKLDYIPPTNGHVYDFSVEDLETFTTFDGIITHNTLNTFHFAGVAEMNVTMGLPRIIEILDGRKELDTPMMEIYLNKSMAKGKDIEELRKFALSIKETKFQDVISEFSINITDLTVVAKLDKEKLKDIGMTNSKVIEAITKQTKGLSIKDDGDSLAIKSKSKEDSFNEIYRIKEKVRGLNIKGIKGISQVLPVKRDDEFIIVTAGSNLSEILKLEEVDSYRTATNNIFEIEQVLGIEAAREAIIREVYKVIESQGLNVDVRHIMLVADTMCVSGTIKGITRYGVVSEKSSVLARASFETPIKNIINAALVGEVDELNSVVENAMINQTIPIGTGMPKLIMKSLDKKQQ